MSIKLLLYSNVNMNTHQPPKKDYTFDKGATTISPINPLEGENAKRELQLKQLYSVFSKLKFTLYSATGYLMTHYILHDRKVADDFIKLVEKGNIKVKINEQEQIINTPTIIFAHKGDLFSWETLDDQPAEVYGIHGILLDDEGFSILSQLNCTFFELKQSQHLREKFKQIYNFYHLNMDLARLVSSDFIRELLLSAILAGYSINFEHWTVPDEVLRKAISLIQSQPLKNYNVNELAAQLKLSRIQLYRKFQHYFQKSVKDYILHHRLTESRKLLLDSHRSIPDIAEELGYCSETHFYKLFKSYYGITPKKFREQYTAF